MNRLSTMPESDRPREKLVRRGPKSLSGTELLAVLLGTGTARRGVMKLAMEAVAEYHLK